MIDFIPRKIYGVTRDEIMSVLKSCKECQAEKWMTTKKEIRPIVAKHPGVRYLIDMIDLRYYSNINDGYSWIMVGIDSFSKYAFTVKCKTKSAVEVSEAIQKMFFTLSPPIILHTDNGKEFKNCIVENICSKMNVKHVFRRVRCPWIQGQVERCNQTFKRTNSKTCSRNGIPGKWTLVLDEATYDHNNSLHSKTKFKTFDLMLRIPDYKRKNENYTKEQVQDEIAFLMKIWMIYLLFLKEKYSKILRIPLVILKR